MTDTTQPSFILASASPRRKQLLKKAGYIFKVIPSNVDELGYSASGKTPEQFALELAYAKAVSIAERYPDMLVLGADTVVDLDGTIIGKLTKKAVPSPCLLSKVIVPPRFFMML